jgi:hypothetical protein
MKAGGMVPGEAWGKWELRMVSPEFTTDGGET